MNRRSFVKAAVAAGAVLALPFPARRRIVLRGDGVTDDTSALQAWLDGEDVYWPDGSGVGRTLAEGTFLIRDCLDLSRARDKTIIGCNFHGSRTGYFRYTLPRGA
jgi:hypothetical protein